MGTEIQGVTLFECEFNTAAISASAAHRGELYYSQGITGAADVVYVILKSHDDTYKAVPMVSGIT